MVGSKDDCIRWLLDATGEEFEVDHHYPKRSLTANSYYHALKSQLAKVLCTTPEELHRELINRYSVVDTDVTSLTARNDLPLEKLPGYWMVGKVSQDGKWKSLIKLKGSSEMDSNEFSRLLDGLIEECEEQGIATITENELAKLKGYAQKDESITDTERR